MSGTRSTVNLLKVEVIGLKKPRIDALVGKVTAIRMQIPSPDGHMMIDTEVFIGGRTVEVIDRVVNGISYWKGGNLNPEKFTDVAIVRSDSVNIDDEL